MFLHPPPVIAKQAAQKSQASKPSKYTVNFHPDLDPWRQQMAMSEVAVFLEFTKYPSRAPLIFSKLVLISSRGNK
jgi:hypothetical protein